MSDEWDEDTTASSVEALPLQALRAAAERHHRRACLIVLTGAASGQLIKLARGASVLGRAPTAEVRLVDDGVSRQHARIRLEGEQVWLEDLGSRNGTFVNGARLTQPTPLRDGDKLQVGRTTVLRFAYQDDLDESFHEHLLSSALRDPLTRLFNKRYFLDRLDSELKFAHRHGTSLSLLMIDLDHFKRVNDTHGHLAGDAVLVKLAGVLAGAVRNEDVVARFGGEELGVILRAIPLEPAVQLADRLRVLIEQTVTLYNGLELRATASIGAAGVPTTQVSTAEGLIEAADRALYTAKGRGRNRVHRPTLQ